MLIIILQNKASTIRKSSCHKWLLVVAPTWKPVQSFPAEHSLEHHTTSMMLAASFGASSRHHFHHTSRLTVQFWWPHCRCFQEWRIPSLRSLIGLESGFTPVITLSLILWWYSVLIFSPWAKLAMPCKQHCFDIVGCMNYLVHCIPAWTKFKTHMYQL